MSVDTISQKYVPMNFTDGVWIEESRVGANNTDKQFHCNGDTIIGEEIYFKLYEMCVNYIEPTFLPDTVPPTHIGFIKENESKQVLFRMLDDTYFSVIYDFNLSLGDTINMPSEPFIINSIDSVEFCGKYHKRYIHSIESGKYPVTLTEGIGYSNGLFGLEGIFNGVEAYDRLECYTEWGNEQCDDCQVLLSESGRISFLSVYPNPTNGDIRISSSIPFLNIAIYNLSGIKLFSTGNTSSNSQFIPFRNYPPGIYLITVWYDNQSYESVKIIKN